MTQSEQEHHIKQLNFLFRRVLDVDKLPFGYKEVLFPELIKWLEEGKTMDQMGFQLSRDANDDLRKEVKKAYDIIMEDWYSFNRSEACKILRSIVLYEGIGK